MQNLKSKIIRFSEIDCFFQKMMFIFLEVFDLLKT